jgi:hypothetical protein
MLDLCCCYSYNSKSIKVFCTGIPGVLRMSGAYRCIVDIANGDRASRAGTQGQGAEKTHRQRLLTVRVHDLVGLHKADAICTDLHKVYTFAKLLNCEIEGTAIFSYSLRTDRRTKAIEYHQHFLGARNS